MRQLKNEFTSASFIGTTNLAIQILAYEIRAQSKQNARLAR